MGRLKKLLPLISVASLVANLGGIAASPALAKTYHHSHPQTREYRQAIAHWEKIRRVREAQRVQRAGSPKREQLSHHLNIPSTTQYYS